MTMEKADTESKARIASWKDFTFILLSTLMVMFPISPLNSPTTNIDSGVFLYIGQRMLQGDIPYGNIWDHKPPIIYFINALGLAISNGSRWGVWVIEFIVLFLAAFLSFHLFEKAFGKTAALVSTFLWLFNLVFLLLSGNLTEEYVLILQFASIFLFYRTAQGYGKPWTFLIIGLLGGIAFLTKQTTIGIWVSIGLILLFQAFKTQNHKKHLSELALMATGVFLIIVIVSCYFFFQNSLPDFWDQAFRYSFIYSRTQSAGILERLKDAFNLKYLAHYSLFPISVIGIVCYFFFRKEKSGTAQKILLDLVAIDIILELLLINIPGHAYEHYYITILPALAVFCAFAISQIKFIAEGEIKKPTSSYLIAFFLLFLFVIGSLREYASNFLSQRSAYDAEAIIYVQNNTSADDTVFIWGAQHAMVNFYSNRASPSKYIYVFPLQRIGYTSEDKILEFLEELEKGKPALIINAEPKKGFMKFPIHTPAIEEKINQLMGQYYQADFLGEWQVYKLK